MKGLGIDQCALPLYIVKQIDFTKNMRLHEKVQNKPNEWRIGQAYFNYAFELYPEETNELRGTEYDCFYDNHKIPIFLKKLNENLLKNKNMANTIEFEGKTFTVNGKNDEKFVNDKICELREKRNNLQDKIFDLKRQLDNITEELNKCQNEIDQEFLKQEHAYDLVGKYILYKDNIYHVNEVERLFTGVRIKSNICVSLHINRASWINPYRKAGVSIPFDDLNILLNDNTETCKILSEEEFKTIVKELIDKTL